MENTYKINTGKSLNHYRGQMKVIIQNQYFDAEETVDYLKRLHRDVEAMVEAMKITEDSDYYEKSEKLLNDIECYIDILL